MAWRDICLGRWVYINWNTCAHFKLGVPIVKRAMVTSVGDPRISNVLNNRSLGVLLVQSRCLHSRRQLVIPFTVLGSKSHRPYLLFQTCSEHVDVVCLSLAYPRGFPRASWWRAVLCVGILAGWSTPAFSIELDCETRISLAFSLSIMIIK